DQHRIDPALKEEETSGWGVINFKAGMKYKGLSIFAGVENVFDRLYFEHLSYQRDPFSSGVNIPEIGRNFYLHLTWTF
ncbi:MAG: ligand-gated channel, partial [Syntrophobacterales bacterium CG_4_8_14_3_um_filter_49_14]